MSLHPKAKHVLAAALIIGAAALAGCGKSASTVAPEPRPPGTQPLTQTAAADIAAQLGVTLARDFGARSGAIAQSVTPALDRGSYAATEAAGDSASGSIWFSVTVRFFDAAGNEQATYDPETTVRVRVDRRVRGSFTTPQATVGMASAAHLDVLGVDAASDRLTTNGAANDTLGARFVSNDGLSSREVAAVAAGTLEDIVQLKPAESHPWPLSGVLRWRVNARQLDTTPEGSAEALYFARAVVRFNGTPHPEIEFEEGWKFRVDLRTGVVTPA